MRGAVVLFCAFAFCTCAAAQSNSWAAVQGLAAGSPVEVRLARGVTVKGTLVAVSASGIDLRTPSTIRYISRARIRTLFLTGNTHKLREAWVGFGFGEIIGTIAGAQLADGDCGPPPAPGAFYGYQPCRKVAGAAFTGALFGALGAGAGALMGLAKSPRALVYERGSGGNHRHQKTAKRRKPIPTVAPVAASGSAGN
ncbi:MAG: hypothetical protein ACRD2E_06270 [Terriglobales bacterium]